MGALVYCLLGVIPAGRSGGQESRSLELCHFSSSGCALVEQERRSQNAWVTSPFQRSGVADRFDEASAHFRGREAAEGRQERDVSLK